MTEGLALGIEYKDDPWLIAGQRLVQNETVEHVAEAKDGAYGRPIGAVQWRHGIVRTKNVRRCIHQQ